MSAKLRQTLLLLLVLLVTLALSATPDPPRPASFCDFNKTDPRYFQRLLDEDFNSPNLDASLFNIIDSDEKYGYSFACGRNALCTADNVYIEDGDLVLRTHREKKQSPTNATRVYEWTSAGVHTRDKFEITPTNDTVTRICIRALLPSGEFKEVDGEIIDTGASLFPACMFLLVFTHILSSNSSL